SCGNRRRSSAGRVQFVAPVESTAPVSGVINLAQARQSVIGTQNVGIETAMAAIRVLIVDDHAVVAAGLERVLQSDGRLRVVGVTRTMHETLAFLRRISPDVILLDLRLPDSRDLGTITAVRASCPTAKVVVFTGASTVSRNEAKNSGADAFLDK